MAEIEHFVNATKGKEGKKHPRFASVANTVLNLFPQEQQLTTGKLRQDLTVGEAVAQGIIDNETLGYFLVRTRAFLLKLGIKEEWLRFRQHLKTEMAHYASDCWDAEIFCYTNRWEWIECVGHADRSAYDLTVHEKASKRNLRASYKLDVPEKVDIGEVEYKDPRLLGKTFKKDQLKLKEYLEELGREDTAAALAIGAKLEAEGKATIGPVECLDGRSFEITSEMIAIKKKTITVYERKFLPSVIEPSFGIGRIMNAAFQHNFSVRKGDGEEEEDEEGKGDGKKKKKKKGKKKGKKDERKPCVLSFPPAIAPYQACVLPLSKNEEFFADVNAIEASLRAAGVSTRVCAAAVTSNSGLCSALPFPSSPLPSLAFSYLVGSFHLVLIPPLTLPHFPRLTCPAPPLGSGTRASTSSVCPSPSPSTLRRQRSSLPPSASATASAVCASRSQI